MAHQDLAQQAWGALFGKVRQLQYAGQVERMQHGRPTSQVCKWRDRLWWRSMQKMLPHGGVHHQSHLLRGSNICPWEENLETLGDRLIGTIDVVEQPASHLRWGCRPLSWWGAACGKGQWSLPVRWFVQALKW